MLHRPPPARWLPLVVALPLLAGCATVNPFRHSATDPTEDALVHVSNDRWEDLTVYLLREGSLFRLGVVSGKSSTRLTVPADYVRLNCTLRLVARTIGRETQSASEEFGIGPGSRIRWHIPLTSGTSPVAITPPGWGPRSR